MVENGVIIKTLIESNAERQKIINKLVFEGVDKGDKIRELQRRVKTLERFVFQAYPPGKN